MPGRAEGAGRQPCTPGPDGTSPVPDGPGVIHAATPAPKRVTDRSARRGRPTPGSRSPQREDPQHHRLPDERCWTRHYEPIAMAKMCIVATPGAGRALMLGSSTRTTGFAASATLV